MINKPLDLINGSDLDMLVTFGRTEGRTLDFKETFPGAGERQVKDFLADVTALANTDGGDIVIGVREDGNGVASEIIGIPDVSLDQDLLRIEGQLRDCVDPRVIGFRVHTIKLEEGRVALVLRVPASLTSPHRVIYAKSSRFYARNSRGNHEMSTSEIRMAFAATENMPERIRDLHHKAIKATTGENMPVRLMETAMIIVTVAPLSVLREPRDVDVTKENACLPPLGGGYDLIVGLDGVIAYAGYDQDSKAAQAWAVNHRRGYIDFAWTIGRVVKGDKTVFRRYIDDNLDSYVKTAAERLRAHGLEGPWLVMATLNGIREFRMVLGDGYPTDRAWQDPAYLGEVIADRLDAEALAPLIGAFWRVFGIDRPPQAS